MAGKLPLCESPSQTAGPYLHIGCTPNQAGIEGIHDQDLGAQLPAGNDDQLYDLDIRVFDGQEELVADAMIEIWISEKAYWARRVINSETGSFAFKVLKPSPFVDEAGCYYSPHISVWIVARGINLGLYTRIYFPDEENDGDFALDLVPKKRRHTLIAEKTNRGYGFNVYLQGKQETVFFDV